MTARRGMIQQKGYDQCVSVAAAPGHDQTARCSGTLQGRARLHGTTTDRQGMIKRGMTKHKCRVKLCDPSLTYAITSLTFLVQSNLPKWILLKWINCLNGYHLSGSSHNIKYKTWISEYSTLVDTHNQVPVLFT